MSTNILRHHVIPGKFGLLQGIKGLHFQKIRIRQLSLISRNVYRNAENVAGENILMKVKRLPSEARRYHG